MADLFEMIMVVCFGVSWPLNIIKALRARSTKGISLPFYLLIWIGYIFAIISKFIKIFSGIHVPFYVVFFYFLNAIMVSIGIVIYFRNRKLDKAAKLEEKNAR